jgi:hypothetical protein
MDIRQNPVTAQQVLLQVPLRADAPPQAGPAAASPVPPGLPQPMPSVVALSEAARSLALRGDDAGKKGGSETEIDFAAMQLELMLGLLKVYTPPPPPSPQELGQAVAEEVALQREQLEALAAEAQAAEAGDEPAAAEPQPVASEAAPAADAAPSTAEPGPARADSAPRLVDDAVEPSAAGKAVPEAQSPPPAAPPEPRAVARYAAVDAATAAGPGVDLRA